MTEDEIFEKYRTSEYSLGYASEQLKMAPADFMDEAVKRGIPRLKWIPEDAREELIRELIKEGAIEIAKEIAERK